MNQQYCKIRDLNALPQLNSLCLQDSLNLQVFSDTTKNQNKLLIAHHFNKI